MIRTCKILGVLALAACVWTPAASATSFEFLFSASHASNDNQFFLNLAVGNSGYPRTVIEPVLPRLRYVEADLPVVLLLARESGRPIDFVVGLRAGGLSWSVIFGRCGVPYDVLFAGIDRDPGPPYGKAWGYWKKHPKRMRLSDDDIVGLAHVQTGRRVTGMSAYEIARARGQGKPVASLVADKKGRTHVASVKGARTNRSGPEKGAKRTEGRAGKGRSSKGQAAKNGGKSGSKGK